MMERTVILPASVALFCATTLPLAAQTPTINGSLGVEARSFTTTDTQPNDIASVFGEIRSKGGITDSLSYDVRLYGRHNLDGLDGGYFDPTVAKLTWQSGNWQVDVGYDLLFWGVAEGRNVVNVINQRDQIRDPLFDQGLGQSMIALRYFAPSVTVEAFVLPKFEELDFGPTGRPWGLGLPVDDHRSTFESADGADHIDYALRVSGNAGNLDYAAFVFDGTLRQPEFRLDPASMTLVPHYALGRQVGVEAQYTSGALLYKFEGLHVWPDSSDSYWSAILGGEYLLGDFFGLPWETSLFAEYYRDSRQDDPAIVFQNDIFLGAQFRLPNSLDTKIELGTIFDAEHDGIIGTLNVSSRLTDSLSATAEYIFVDASDPQDGLFNARDYDQASIGLQWNF